MIENLSQKIKAHSFAPPSRLLKSALPFRRSSGLRLPKYAEVASYQND